MEFIRGGAAGAVALLPGAWNPPTCAHTAMAEAALDWADRAILVLPRIFPHKPLEGAPFAVRAKWLALMAQGDPRLGAAVSDGGLFIEMAREVRAAGAESVYLVCGRDAAERITGWDYSVGAGMEEQLNEYQILVAPRQGDFQPELTLASRIHTLRMGPEWHDVSSSEVRRRIEAGEAWRHLVPESIVDSVAAAYS
jgi:nicotinic acid mononucleotide adenylyltransferase